MKKIVGLGACVLDTIITCDDFPSEDTKKKAENIFVTGGGPVANAMVISRKLGARVSIIGAFGDDENGSAIRRDLEKHGVDITNVRTAGNASSFCSYVIISKNNKTRTCIYDRGSVPDDEASLSLTEIDDADVLHLDGNYLKSAICAAKYARSKGVKVSLDAGGLYDGIDGLLPLVDIMIPSAEFVRGFTKENDLRSAINVFLTKFSPEVFAVTNGADGGYYLQDGEIRPYKSLNIDPVDTNGAGDTFHGAFLSAYLHDKSVKECCEFASAVAAYKYTELAYMGLKVNDPSRVLGIEDSSAGIMSLRFAGFNAVGLESGNITKSGLNALCIKKVATLDEIQALYLKK